MTKALHGKTQDLSDQVVKVMPNSEFEDCMIQLREIEAKILQEPYSGTAVDLISQYRELILVSIVCITQLNRKLCITWKRSGGLKIENGGQKQDKETVAQIAEVVRAVDFIEVLERRYKEAQVKAHDEFRVRFKELQIEKFERYQDEVVNERKKSGVSRNSDEVKAKSKKQQLLSTNKKITSTLMRTSQLVQTSVLQSELNLGELQEQTRSLNKLNDRFESLSGVLNTSSKVVKIINESSGRERRQIYTGLAFLGLCISWVLWRRIFKMPVKLMLWVWFRFFRSILGVLGVVPKVHVGTSVVPGTVISSVVSATPTKIIEEATGAMQTMVEEALDDVFARLKDEL